ncbi:MAG: ATP-dependent DNA helicase RecG [Rhodocyclaceae bacterium]|nr:ATP-dependent DNA helicase RecG [Rhodocyclaceae bacterium]MBX3667732.1 ATP-dependent DNA helicase RecG [Rhodocyclaceae bacterium]
MSGNAGSAPARSLREKLEALGLVRDIDLALHFPLRYEDETRVLTVAEAPQGQAVQLEVKVVEAEVEVRGRRQLRVLCEDASGEIELRFFNFYPSHVKQLAPGALLRLYGELRHGWNGIEMVHPRFKLAEAGAALPDTLTPVYPTTAGLGQASLRRAIDAALARVDLSDTLPEADRERYKLMNFAAAVRALHRPLPGETLQDLDIRLQPARARVAFDELLAQQMSLRLAYAERRARRAPQLAAPGARVAELLAALPFQLTAAQQRVWEVIAADLTQPYPMQRLLQGDVGSGKTVLAALAALQAVESGFQAAIMAPTEILAEQHYRKLSTWLQPLGMQVAWLSGSQTARQKQAARAQLASGAAHIAVGTHALIVEGIAFERLALAVVDEQHRFGVRQRLVLREKGDAATAPHLLMMSATPIPRTLAMSYYADLDLSVLDELPPGRQPVLTKLVSEARRDEVIFRVRAACAEGRQAYWVCPLIEESEALQLQTALDTHARLVAELPELGVGLLHGRLKADEKSAVMAQFSAGTIQLLVATTVVEVGVDVPNASLMVIEHAERFGLSQLHQLRGRVGRGGTASVCVLLYAQPLSEAARARLKVIYENADGFEIARQDLALRGPGEFAGSRQSGEPLLRFADLERDAGLLDAARDCAERLLAAQSEAVAPHLARWMRGREAFLKA